MQCDELISVVVPAYNGAFTIDETLRSVRSQTYAHLEILVVDDGSLDDTSKIVQRHAAEDYRVRLIQQANEGVAAARNNGVAHAKGALIAFVDADDLWSPSKIEKQVLSIKAAGSQCALSYTWYAGIDKDSLIIDRSNRPTESGNVLARMCNGNLVGNGSSALVRKSAVLEVGGFNTTLRAQRAQGCEDLHFYFRIAERHSFALVPEFLTGYRSTPTNMSSDLIQMYRSWMLVSKEMQERQPRLAKAVRTGTSGYIGFLLDRSISLRQPRQAFFFGGCLLIRDPSLLATVVFSRARTFVRGWRQSRDPQILAQERFVIGMPETGC